MKSRGLKKTLLRDFVVTVGLLAMTLLSFMSKRVVPMGTSWYLPWGIRICVGIVLLICMVLFWDMVKRGNVDGSACERCGEQVTPYSIPVYFLCGNEREDTSRTMEMDVRLCHECYHALKHIELWAVWIGLLCCLVLRVVVLAFSATRWEALVVPLTPIFNASIPVIAYIVSIWTWSSRKRLFERECRLVRQLLAKGLRKIEIGSSPTFHVRG